MISFLSSASQFSPQIDHLALILFSACAAIVLLVFGLIIFFCIRYRSQAQVNRDHPPERNRKLEFGLISGILGLGLCTFWYSTRIYFEMYSPPEKNHEIFGVAKQWLWIFHDPGGKDQINELTVTLGEPTRLTLISEDVIHSLSIPAFRVKQDVLPNRYTTLWFTPTALGDFPLFCTQYCGLSHSQMLAVVHVVKPSAGWVNQSKPVSLGKKLFQEKGCVACHSPALANRTAIGPSLKGLYHSKVIFENGETLIADENYLRESIVNPSARLVKGYSPVMPTFKGLFNETELAALVEYLKSECASAP